MIEKYKRYVKTLLEADYHFNEEDINDILQNIELANIEAEVRGADQNMKFAIIRKATVSAIRQRERELRELGGEEIENYSVHNSEEKVNDSREILLSSFATLSKKDRGILLARLLKGQPIDYEFVEVIESLTDAVEEKNPELASRIYEQLCAEQDEKIR